MPFGECVVQAVIRQDFLLGHLDGSDEDQVDNTSRARLFLTRCQAEEEEEELCHLVL
jgi:hypothetical protein